MATTTMARSSTPAASVPATSTASATPTMTAATTVTGTPTITATPTFDTSEPVRLIVRFKPAASIGDRDVAVRQAGAQLVHRLGQIESRVITVPASQKRQRMAALWANPLVESVTEAVSLQVADTSTTTPSGRTGRGAPLGGIGPATTLSQASTSPNDPLYARQWDLPVIGWPQARASVPVSGAATIAVLDTGIDASHADLAGVVLNGQSFTGGNATSDPNGHGTRMAGIAAANVNNGTGIAGVAYTGARLLPVQVLQADGAGWDSDVVAGVLWAADNGANVVLMAFSSPTYSQALADAVAYAQGKGVVVVAATGNDGSSDASYPAGLSGVIGVAATDQQDQLASFSNTGSARVAAPGVNLFSTTPGGGYANVTGTSAAAAVVAGEAALLVASGKSGAVAANQITAGVDALSAQPSTTFGRINLLRALGAALPVTGTAGSISPVSGTPVYTAASGPSLVQSQSAQSVANGAPSQPVTFTSSVAAGDLIVVVVATIDQAIAGQGGESGVADNKGNTYTRAVINSTTVDGLSHSSIWFATNVTGGSSFTITVTGSTSTTAYAVLAYEYSGLSSVSLDKTAIGNASVAGTVVSTGSVTTTGAHEIVVAASTFDDFVSAPATAGTGFTKEQEFSDGSTNEVAVSEDEITSATGTFGSSLLSYASSVTWHAVLATFSGTVASSAPTVSSISPSSGPTAGGTSVTITGTNLSSATGVKFGTTSATGLTGNTSTSITVTSPAGSAGAVDVTVTTAGGTSATSASDHFTYLVAPTISKAFSATGMASMGTTTLTITITNPSANTAALTGLAFTDTLPTTPGNMTVASTPNLSTTCGGGTATGVAGSGSVSLSGGSLAANSSCTVKVDVTASTAGSYSNTTGAVSSTNGGTGTTSNTAVLSVATPPTIAPAFGASTIVLNGSTTLTFTLTNPNTGQSLTGAGFSDTLPSGLAVASTPNVTGTCVGNGTISATGGGSSISLSGATLGASGSCTVVVSVTGSTAGAKNVSVTATSNEAGSGSAGTASLTVVAPPTVSAAFGASSIPLNGSTTLTLTITNPNTGTTLNAIAVSDSLPTNLVVATPNGLGGTCVGNGTISATGGGSSISLSGATLGASGSCTLVVNVTSGAAASYSNTTGAISSTEGGTGATSNTVSLTVVAPPTISKAFGATGIAVNGTTTLTITVANPGTNTAALTGLAFTDTFPTNLVVATSNGLSSSCGGTATGVAGSGSLSLAGGTSLAAGSTCTVTVNVTSGTPGSYSNTTGAVSSTNGGTGTTSNTATLSVATPPTIAEAFGASTIALNGSTTLTFTVTNPGTNTMALTGIGFTDTLPSGLGVASTPGVTGTCAGNGTITATGGATSVSLSGATLTAGASCTVVVNVTGSTAGTKNNSVTATSNEGGSGGAGTASLTVVSPPTISKAFGATSIPLNGSTTLTFTIANPNSGTTVNGIGFSDTLPAGLVISTPNGLGGTCGGTPTAAAGSASVSLSALSLAGSTSCTLVVNVTGSAAGAQSNTTGAISSTEGGSGTTSNTTSIAVVAPPTITKAFSPTSSAVNGVSTLTITIANPGTNTVALTGVAFSDTFPTNLVIATPNGLSTTCGGTATGVAGSGSLSLAGGSVASGSSCSVAVNVSSSTAGSYGNTSGAVSAANGGTGTTSNTATLTVVPPPTVSAVSPASGPLGGGTTVTITGTNLTGATAVSFGTHAASSFTVNSATQVTATSPAVSAGTVDVTITTGGGTSATSTADQFTYVAAPTVTSISPTSGPAAGGTSVTINGTNFSGASAVKFGSVATGTYTVSTPTQISATSPGGTPGAVDVTVTTVGGTSATSAADQFTNLAATSTTLTSSSNPSITGQSVTFTAAVTVTTTCSCAVPTGIVTFKDGSATMGTGTLAAGSATFGTSTLSIGSHPFTAVYGGDSVDAGSTSAALTQVVNPPPPPPSGGGGTPPPPPPATNQEPGSAPGTPANPLGTIASNPTNTLTGGGVVQSAATIPWANGGDVLAGSVGFSVAPQPNLPGSMSISVQPQSGAGLPIPGGPAQYSPNGTLINVKMTDDAGNQVTTFQNPITLTVKYNSADVGQASGQANNLTLGYFVDATTPDIMNPNHFPVGTLIIAPPSNVTLDTTNQLISFKLQAVSQVFAVVTNPVEWVQTLPLSANELSSFDTTNAQVFGTKPQFSYLQVMEPQIGTRLYVRDPITGNFAYVNAPEVGPSGPPPFAPE